MSKIVKIIDILFTDVPFHRSSQKETPIPEYIRYNNIVPTPKQIENMLKKVDDKSDLSEVIPQYPITKPAASMGKFEKKAILFINRLERFLLGISPIKHRHITRITIRIGPNPLIM